MFVPYFYISGFFITSISVNEEVVSQNWMLGLFGTIISALLVLLVSNVRAGFNKLELKVDKLQEGYNDHETRIQLLQSENDIEGIVEKIMTKFGGLGTRFNTDDFRKH